MRTFFEVEQPGEFQVARDLLVRRCVAWARGLGLPAEPLVLAAALDSRQLSADGRLTLWTPAHVRRFLLEWIPQQVAADPADLKDAPGSLGTLLRYLAESGLRDPRGASLKENEAATAAAADEFPAALADRERWGIAKFWALAASENGVDITDPRAMSRFTADVEAGRVDYDGELLGKLMDVRFGGPGLVPERTIAQLPVSLPPAEELAEAAGRSQVVRQLGAFADWVGANGAVLTAAGNLKPADARRLVDLLGTGEQGMKARSSVELPHLNLIVTWAKKARLVRVSGTKLVRVAKARPLLDDAEALWQRAFEAFFELRDVICLPLWVGDSTSMLYDMYAEVVPDMLNTIYSLPYPMPVARLEESVWMSCRERFNVDAGSPRQQQEWRGHVGRDLARVFEMLAALGAVEVTHGVADEMFSADLADDFEMPIEAERPIAGDTAARLREELARPGKLVALTALGTRVMRRRLLAEGREAGLVGELAAAEPAELLGVVAEHYTPETGAAEIAGWLAAHDGAAEPLVDAVRTCPFRSRAAAMLDALTLALPSRRAFLRGLRDDAALAPITLTALLGEGSLEEDELTPREHALVMTEGLLQLLETAGPEIVHTELSALPEADIAGLLEAMRACEHPGTATMRDFDALVAVPLSG